MGSQDLALPDPPVDGVHTRRATARFAIDAYALACRADDPGATVDEVFRMFEAAWEATTP